MLDFSLPEKALEPFEQSNIVSTALLEHFLEQTVDLDLCPSERFRFLAINLEHHEFTDGWFSLYRIYELAIAEDPANIDVYHSVAISALDWFESYRTKVIQDRIKIAAIAEQRICQAINLSPLDSDLHYTYGQLLYNHPKRVQNRDTVYIEHALKQFREAIARNPNHQMAVLYEAHCLHDLELCSEAFKAYSSVRSNELLQQHPHSKWRVLKLQEQKALCAANIGDENTAIALLTNFLDQVESLTAEDVTFEVVNLDESVQVLTTLIENPALLKRLKKFARTADWERFYEW